VDLGVIEICDHRRSPVGASLLAMVANDDALCLNGRGILAFFASWLAPTLDWIHQAEMGWLSGRHR
jgi:hypothetical protein